MILPVTGALRDSDDVLTLSEFKSFIVDAPDSEDSEILQAIKSAFEDLEDDTGRAYGQRTYDMVLDGFSTEIVLPMPPLISVTSVNYVDTSDVTQTVSSSDYSVHGVNATGLNNRGEYGGYIRVGDNGWPSDLKELPESVIIRFVAGYAAPNIIPWLAKQATRIRTAKYYSFKGDSYSSEIERDYQNTISSLIVYSFV